jgi:hypothetical protein
MTAWGNRNCNGLGTTGCELRLVGSGEASKPGVNGWRLIFKPTLTRDHFQRGYRRKTTGIAGDGDGWRGIRIIEGHCGV